MFLIFPRGQNSLSSVDPVYQLVIELELYSKHNEQVHQIYSTPARPMGIEENVLPQIKLISVSKS